ncbi:MAG: hypothetical protein ACRD1N_07150 [Terriglobia bacterium]
MMKPGLRVLVLAVVCAVIVSAASPGMLWARRHKKEKKAAGTDGPTAQLFDLLDNSFGGKLDIYLLADIYTDTSNGGAQYQRVLHVTYDKSLYFGRFAIHVRSVGKMSQEQMAIYNAKAVYNFGDADTQEFEKINPGPFGGTGDLYLQASDDHPLAEAPITDKVQQEYEMLLTKYILPAVQKQNSAK